MELPSKKLWSDYCKVIKKPQRFENTFVRVSLSQRSTLSYPFTSEKVEGKECPTSADFPAHLFEHDGIQFRRKSDP